MIVPYEKAVDELKEAKRAITEREERIEALRWILDVKRPGHNRLISCQNPRVLR